MINSDICMANERILNNQFTKASLHLSHTNFCVCCFAVEALAASSLRLLGLEIEHILLRLRERSLNRPESA